MDVLGEAMAEGYVGRILFVDLGEGWLWDEKLNAQFCQRYIGGYGFDVIMIRDHQNIGADPLGPNHALCFLTGPLADSELPFGSYLSAVNGPWPMLPDVWHVNRLVRCHGTWGRISENWGGWRRGFPPVEPGRWREAGRASPWAIRMFPLPTRVGRAC